jgi:hypothetical protein
MSDDLVKRLRYCAPERRDCGRNELAMLDAADLIEKLEAALEKIAQHDMQAIAMDALRPGERIRKALEGKMNLIEMLRANGSWEADAAASKLHSQADRIEKLKDELHHCFHRINELQAALREIVGALDDPKGGQHVYDMRNASYIARKALEGKDD